MISLYGFLPLSFSLFPFFERLSHTVYRAMVVTLKPDQKNKQKNPNPTSVLKANCQCRAILKQSGVPGILICMTIPTMLLQLHSFLMKVLMVCLSIGNKVRYVLRFACASDSNPQCKFNSRKNNKEEPKAL